MIKSILGGKSKNLFDISKVVTSNRVKRNGNSLICSSYGTSIGTLGSICPTLKPSDLITVSFKCASEGAPSNFMAFDGKTFPSGATFLVSEIGLSTPWYLYNTDYTHRDIPNKTTYSDIQIELGSTATEYVPHELTSYKSIMKVSDVCQLVPISDKADNVVNEITFTNNHDGGWTISGTHSEYTWYTLFMNIPLKNGHKYLNAGAGGGTYIEIKWYDKDDVIHWEDNPYTADENSKCDITLMRASNVTGVKIVFPQLFDLTEMFGAGNEPKTVAEFKAKFPNDYYPYSPSCFVTSFDERMPCKTKNLFDKSNAQIINGYISGRNVFSPSSLDKTIIIPCLPNTTYTFSKISVSPVACDRLRIGDYTAIPAIGDTINNVVNIGEPPTQNYITITTSDTAKYIVVTIGLFNYKVITTLDYILSTCQLELGTTATDYVPYGYV